MKIHEQIQWNAEIYFLLIFALDLRRRMDWRDCARIFNSYIFVLCSCAYICMHGVWTTRALITWAIHFDNLQITWIEKSLVLLHLSFWPNTVLVIYIFRFLKLIQCGYINEIYASTCTLYLHHGNVFLKLVFGSIIVVIHPLYSSIQTRHDLLSTTTTTEQPIGTKCQHFKNKMASRRFSIHAHAFTTQTT